MIKILFTTPVLEHPAAGGPQLRIENSIKALSRISELYIISRVSLDKIGGLTAQKYYENYCKQFLFASSVRNDLLSSNKYLRKIQRLFVRLFNPDHRFIIKYAEEHSIDVIWFGYGNISYDLIKKIKKIRPKIKTVCDTDSVWSRYIMRELPFENGPQRKQKLKRQGEQKEKEEASWVNMCEVTTAVSEVDAEYYKKLTKEKNRIKIFSNVIDLETYKSHPPPPEGIKKPCIYLAGTFGHYHSPMDRAARWVLEEVYPKVKAELPNITFYIVGKESERTLSYTKDPSVIIVGKVPTVLPYLCNVDVALVPLKFESGTRFKILEAAACGIPIVSTTLGAEGIPVTHDKDIQIADDPEDFAKAIIKLIKNKEFANSIAYNCKIMVQDKYSLESLAEGGMAILRYLRGE